MDLELDHVFILVEPEAKVADHLVSLGLTEGFSRTHQGQGTANRRFEFSNGMLEFLWVRDVNEANHGPAKHLLFPERHDNPQASPFGVILTKKNNTDQGMPFPGIPYQPDYFDPPMAFHIGENASKITEPLCIYVPFMDAVKRNSEEGLFKTLTQVRIHTLETAFSNTLNTTHQADRLSIQHGTEHLLELTLDEHRLAMTKDFRPHIPLLLHW